MATVEIGFNMATIRLTKKGVRAVKRIKPKERLEYIFEHCVCEFGYCLVDNETIFVKSNIGYDWSFCVDKHFLQKKLVNGVGITVHRLDAMQRPIWGAKNIPDALDFKTLLDVVKKWPDLAKRLANAHSAKMQPLDVLLPRIVDGRMYVQNQLNESFFLFETKRKDQDKISLMSRQLRSKIKRYVTK